MSTSPRYMLDTNIASYAIRGGMLQSRLGLRPLSALCISAITEAELLFGVAKRADAPVLKTAVSEFLRRVQPLAWDSGVAATYAALRARLESQGTPLGSLDTLIAAHAIACGCVLVTNDKAMARVPELRAEDWSVA
jgi:tRNA(fMet)-specific endonuclease VapC